MGKKILIAILFFILIGGAVWFFVFRGGMGDAQNPGDSFLRNLFPFGQENDVVPEPNNPQGATSTPDGSVPEEAVIPRLRQIHEEPVAGAALFKDGSVTKIRFVERATGHIFESSTDTVSTVRLSNTTIPKIYEALWNPNGNEVLLRYLRDDTNTIRTFYTRIGSSTEPDQSIEGLFLDDGIRNIDVLGRRVFYFDSGEPDTRGIASNLDGTSKTALFSSGFGNFIPSWTSPGSILLFTAPRSNLAGTIYNLNSSSGGYRKIASDLFGAVPLMNPQGTKVFVSTGGSSIGAQIIDVSTLAARSIDAVTIADKCVWSNKDASVIYCAVPKFVPQGSYPDSWYQGIVSFNDRIWRINADTGETELLFDPRIDGGEEMDAAQLILGPEDGTLSFINKKDLSLWIYLLEI